MTPLETRALALANRLITKFGQQVTWKQTRDGDPVNPLKPYEPTASVVTEFTPTVCFLSSNRKTLEALMYLTGTEIPDGYMRGIMAGNPGFVPALKDMLVRDGNNIAVLWIDAFNPQGTPLIYTFGFKP